MTGLVMPTRNIQSERKRKTHSHFRILSDLLSRMLLLALFTLAAAGVFIFLFSLDGALHPLALRVTTIIGVGLAAGFSARWLLRNSMPLLRLLSALCVLLVVFIALGYWSNGFIGIAFVRRAAAGQDWNSLWQICLGCVTAGLPVVAWNGMLGRRPRRRGKTRLQKWVNAFKRRLAASFTWLTASLHRIFRPVKLPTFPAFPTRVASTHSQSTSSSVPSSPSLRRTVRAKIMRPIGSPPSARTPLTMAPRRRKGKSAVQLFGTEEHRCPYCLDPVNPKDPRGYAVCSICGAFHHKDCWEITGACQVPHNHE